MLCLGRGLSLCQREDIDVEMFAELLHDRDGVVQVSHQHHGKADVEGGHLIAWHGKGDQHGQKWRDQEEVEELGRTACHLTDDQPTLLTDKECTCMCSRKVTSEY